MILSVKSIKIYSFLVCTNMSKIYICHRASVMTATKAARSGEYRGRTDDLLLAKQAL